MKHILQRTRPDHGFTLAELLVGTLIGVIAVLAVMIIYMHFATMTRSTQAVNDTQLDASYALMVIDHLLANAGAGTMNHRKTLDHCQTGDPAVHSGQGSTALLLRAMPVVISEGEATQPYEVDDEKKPATPASASLSIFNSTTHLYPSLIDAEYSKQRELLLKQTPFGIPKNNVLILVSDSACLAYQTNVAISANDQGVSKLPTAEGSIPAGTSAAVDMGTARRSRIYLDGDVLKLQTLSLVDEESNKWQVSRDEALIANVVEFHALYGIDNNGDKKLDAWVKATGDWSAASLANADSEKIKKIVAIKVGMILKVDEPGSKDMLVKQMTLKLFDTANCASGISCGSDTMITRTYTNNDNLNWRYRAFETMIPLRNSIWDAPYLITGEAASTTPAKPTPPTGEKP